MLSCQFNVHGSILNFAWPKEVRLGLSQSGFLRPSTTLHIFGAQTTFQALGIGALRCTTGAPIYFQGIESSTQLWIEYYVLFSCSPAANLPLFSSFLCPQVHWWLAEWILYQMWAHFLSDKRCSTLWPRCLKTFIWDRWWRVSFFSNWAPATLWKAEQEQ